MSATPRPATDSFAESAFEDRETLATRAFLAPEETAIGGLTLRPITLASLSLLQITKNEFLAPRGPVAVNPQTQEEGPTLENEILAALAFAYIHAAPLAEVRRVVWNEAVFREKVLEFGEQIDAAAMAQLTAEIERSLATINALKIATQEKPEEGSAGPTPPPN